MKDINYENKIKESIDVFTKNYEELESKCTFEGIIHQDRDYYVNKFLEYIDDINEWCKEHDTEWAWCNDFTSFGGVYFNPVWVVTANGHIFALRNNLLEDTPYPVDSRRNSRTVIDNSFLSQYAEFPGRLHCKYARLIGNYFCEKPNINEEELQAGHFYHYDSNKPHYLNDNTNNLSWQTGFENTSITERIRHGNWKAAFDKISEKEGIENTVDESLGFILNTAARIPDDKTGVAYYHDSDRRPHLDFEVTIDNNKA